MLSFLIIRIHIIFVLYPNYFKIIILPTRNKGKMKQIFFITKHQYFV